MSFPHKVVLWVRQRRGCTLLLNKGRIFLALYCFVVKPTSVQQLNLSSNFLNEIMRAVSSTKACELTE